MAEKLEDGDLWPPMEFLAKGFFEKRRAAALMPEFVERSGLVRENLSFSSSNMAMEAESDEEDCVAGLARQMAQYSFLGEDTTPSFWDTRILATSPQSTLCDAGIWSAAPTGNPNICSKASPRLSGFQEQRKEDAMDILYAAAGELLRKKQSEQRVSERYQMKNPLVNTKSSQIAGSHNSQNITRQQIQAAQFYKLKQQLLMKQQLSSAWSAQNRVATATSNRPHGLAPPAWSPLQKPQPNPGMRAIFLNASGARRESAGTGVFLPRRAGSPTAKKPVCSTVLLPARVVQALNLNLDDARVNPRYPVHIPRIHETQSARAKPVYNEQKRHFYQPPPAPISGEDIRLPNEWTY